jgi:hypothetical protein
VGAGARDREKEKTMRSDLSFEELLDAALEEPDRSVPAIVEAVMTGADRADDITTPEPKAAAFTKIINDVAGDLPYIGPNWATAIADSLRRGESAAELAQMAQRNRDAYAGTAKIDSGGSCVKWNAALQALTAVATDQVPPPLPPLNTGAGGEGEEEEEAEDEKEDYEDEDDEDEQEEVEDDETTDEEGEEEPPGARIPLRLSEKS